MRAHWRPSLIAHTISDCPRRASPAANTPSTELVYGLAALTLPRGSFSTPSCVEQRLLGVQEAHRQQHELRLQLALGARHGRERRLRLGLRDVQRGDAARAVVGEARSSTTE